MTTDRGPVPPKPPKPPTPPERNISWKSVVANAAHWNGLPHNHEMCDQYAEESVLGHGGVYNDATQYRNWAAKNNAIKTTAPPAGVPVFYAGNASSGHGHVAISAGGGYVYSTDAQGNRVGKVRYDKLWGGTGSGQYLGWTSAIQGTRGGATEYINYDPKTVGTAPTINVPKDFSSTGDKVKSDAGVAAATTSRTSTQPISDSRPSTTSIGSQFMGALSNFFGGPSTSSDSSQSTAGGVTSSPSTSASAALPTVTSASRPSSASPLESAAPSLESASTGSESPLEQPVGKM